ncbi:hypothetical protein NE865_05550 [Phthorimaea operculella]|nr:hypothetical protein NE865_05550 [Phthorimaea operculella]
MATNCAACGEKILDLNFLECTMCEQLYDNKCLNIKTEELEKMSQGQKETWLCPECTCKEKRPVSNRTNTPVRAAGPLNNTFTMNNNVNKVRGSGNRADPGDNSGSTSSNNVNHTEIIDPRQEIQRFTGELRALGEEMSKFRSAMSDLTDTIRAQNDRISKLEIKMDSLEAKVNERQTCTCDVTLLETTIAQLQEEIQERDQETLANDVEITGIPEEGNENTTHLLLAIGKKLGMNLEASEFVKASRVGPTRQPSEEGKPSRPRPIAVRFVHRERRDALLQAARTRRKISTEGLGLSGSSRPFYINERLTKHNRQLFHKSREVGLRLNWKFVWTRDGKVYARQEQGKARHRLRSEADLTRVFGVGAVGSKEGSKSV